jgi:hypothetical protein
MGLTVRNVLQDLESIKARRIVLDKDHIEAGRDGWDRSVRRGHGLGDLDR